MIDGYGTDVQIDRHVLMFNPQTGSGGSVPAIVPITACHMSSLSVLQLSSTITDGWLICIGVPEGVTLTSNTVFKVI